MATRPAQAWTQLKPRIVTFTKGWSEAYGLFLKGEADMVLSYTTSPAYHVAAEKKDNYKAAAFAEGHYLHVELAGMTRTAKQPELAKKFMAFVLSDAFQSRHAGGQLDDARRRRPPRACPRSSRIWCKPRRRCSSRPRRCSRTAAPSPMSG